MGEPWTALHVIEPEWWREHPWTVVAVATHGKLTAWLLRPGPAADGSWLDLSLGILGDGGAFGLWISRGWVARAERVELVILPAPGAGLVAVSERFVDTDDRFGAYEHFFARDAGAVREVDELVVVEGSDAPPSEAYTSAFVPGPTPTYRIAHDGRARTFVFDPVSEKLVR